MRSASTMSIVHHASFIALVACACAPLAAQAQTQAAGYPNNRAPLAQKPYAELPLGSIKAKGWLLEMLNRQKTGATGQMDTLYPEVMGPRNGWLGGDGDQWERGPYWIDGLLPLAYILDDDALKNKARPWVEWILNSQREDGFFGPAKNYKPEPGLQRTNAEDWWPRMVALKILQQHHSATSDPRVLGFMTRYFQYQLKTLPEKPLGKWTFWARYRVCDNLQAVYWLYNITGDAFLLELADLLYKQGHDYADMFLKGEALSKIGSSHGPGADRAVHCVNIAQGIKAPVVYYQQHPEQKYLDAVRKALADIRRFHGQAQGMYGGDEALHGNKPTQGSELCSAVELMYSLETMLAITGDTAFADHLERIAFNALPAQISEDFMQKQYFQQANQVMVTRHTRNFDCNHDGTDILLGLLTGYPCCASNMHQGWPKFTQNLWLSTPDGGLAALVYSPSEVTATVAAGARVKITEDTCYPMDDKIKFTLHIEDNAAPVQNPKSKLENSATFPLRLRIPGWCKNPAITINGQPIDTGSTRAPGADEPRPATGPLENRESKIENSTAIIHRAWKTGDTVELTLPMDVFTSTWYENSLAVERGPLVYALRMSEQWTQKKFPPAEAKRFGDAYYEVTSPDKWNYGIIDFDAKNTAGRFAVTIDPEKQKADFFWSVENAPVQIKARAREIPHWRLYNEMAGPIPHSHGSPGSAKKLPEQEITLIPYGCTKLRISQFPVVK